MSPSIVGMEPEVRLCLAPFLFYPIYAGGAMRFARYLPGFAHRRIATEVLTTVPDGARARLSGLDEARGPAGGGSGGHSGIVNGVPVHRVALPRVRSKTLRELAFGRHLVRFCRSAEARPNVVQLLAMVPGMVPAVLQLRRMGISTISHATIAPDAVHAQSAFRRSLYSLPAGVLDCMIVSSESLKQRLLGMNVRVRMEVIPNGVDTNRFRPRPPQDERGAIRVRLGIPPEDVVLLTVCAVTPRKGTDILLEAWCHIAASCPRLHLIVAGPRSDQALPSLRGFGQRLESLLAQSGASERVHFVGLVEDIEEYYREADIFVFASSREGMPNAVLEAMASGLPVLTTRFIGLTPELGHPGKHFLLVDRSARELAEAIRHLVSDSDLQRRLGAAGRRWVEQEMALEQALDRYAELYREVAAQHAWRRMRQPRELVRSSSALT